MVQVKIYSKSNILSDCKIFPGLKCNNGCRIIESLENVFFRDLPGQNNGPGGGGNGLVILNQIHVLFNA